MAGRPTPPSVAGITYPPELPVSQRRDEIAAAIEANQVVVLAGETGSGKTTQLPKICLDLGRGAGPAAGGIIAHTQPRRLAARTVAARIAQELGTELGETVGYAVRFTDQVSERTLVKLMTDGILLNEIHRDRRLRAYDTIIVDEAHERSLNIDFILGYLTQLLPRRPDLKLVVTSATIDAERFAHHFGGAPVIEVTGRTHPVEIRSRPLDGADPVTAICDAVEELWTEPPGDILVFLSGEREIRDAAGALADLGLPDTEILPLYARLASAEQQRVFAPHRGRRVVLATNVAETSLTVPGVRYVVDPGTARVSRYSHRLKVQRLPIEPVSRASADQRAGRCGRVAPGVCIRLYDEDDYAARPEFTEPEILRTNLASVILQMMALDLGAVADFPFIDPPDRRAIADGMRLLHELGAIEAADPERPDPVTGPARLTRVGRTMARLPVDPRFARMVVEADTNGCLAEVLVIVAALSIEDPRERPSDDRAAADELHRRFADSSSDFLADLALWRHLRAAQRELSGNQFRKLCRAEHLNHLRVREWQDVHSQLRRLAGQLGLRTTGGGDAHPDAVHRSLLAGLLSHIGHRPDDAREFQGARGARFAIFPGSALAKRPPKWVMAAELVETSRLWGRTVARIQPEWAEALAPHLVVRRVAEPHWSPERGAAVAYETVTLYGLPLVTRRTIHLARADPDEARALLIEHALVRGEWATPPGFVEGNRALLEEVEDLEHRYRRDLAVGDAALFDRYDERIPRDVVSTRHLDRWWSRERRRHPDLLTFTVDDLLGDQLDAVDPDLFPAVWRHGELELGMSYVFDPGSPDDGAAVHIPVAVLNQIRAEPFDWQVPGLRVERAAALVRTLPKDLRRNYVPVPDHVRAALDRVADVDPGAVPPGSLTGLLARALPGDGRPPIPISAFDPRSVDPHLSILFVVEGDDGAVLGQGRDLDALRERFGPQARAALAAAAPPIATTGQRTWTFGTIPRRIEVGGRNPPLVGCPSLVDEGDTVGLAVLDRPSAQADQMWAGTRRLLQLTVPQPTRALGRRLRDTAALALTANPYADVTELARACTVAALDELMERHGAPAWDADGFESLRTAVAASLDRRVDEIGRVVARILTTVAVLDGALVRPAPPVLGPALDDIAGQRAALVHHGFVTEFGADRLPDLVRYLRAAVLRVDSLAAQPGRDADRMAQVHRVERAYAEVVDRLGDDLSAVAELERIGWQIEELRVNLFAQQLGTPGPVSEKRIMAAISALGAR